MNKTNSPSPTFLPCGFPRILGEFVSAFFNEGKCENPNPKAKGRDFSHSEVFAPRFYTLFRGTRKAINKSKAENLGDLELKAESQLK